MNPFILHKDDEFDTHLVIFSALNTPKGKFTLYKILSSFPGKKTFINIDRNHWYQHNIPSMGSSLEDSVDAIKSITKKKIQYILVVQWEEREQRYMELKIKQNM
ncbi:hypothetical protein AB2H77_18870 [Escherichia coli]|uniref:hypothetical protein n=1 Tax=Escherichia coli TaxID=562 RepID=UPI0022885F8C|nr:hypothetical protein [Escherichia coli]MCO1115705.1 hypothetical protein [Escherichia coli]HCU5842582.1 hypothetical protein [Escherichia coli]